jgi:hypothetical protein
MVDCFDDLRRWPSTTKSSARDIPGGISFILRSQAEWMGTPSRRVDYPTIHDVGYESKLCDVGLIVGEELEVYRTLKRSSSLP